MAKSKPELLYATNNPGKLDEVGTYLGAEWPIESPRGAGLKIDVEESGQTLEENALLKVRAYRAVVPADTIVMADDTGLEIDALDGEPGVFVRRWRDHQTEMTDQEIIDYCFDRLTGVPNGKRGAQFRTVVALALPDGTEKLFDGTLRGEITPDREYALAHRWEGFPFRGLLYIPEAGVFLGELEQSPSKILTHRQKAVRKAVDWLQGYNK